MKEGESLDLRPADKFIGVFGEAGAPRDHRRRHREFHAELGFEPGLRGVVAQDQRVGLADPDGDFLDLRRLQRPFGEQFEHPVERPMGAVAGRVFLDAESLLQDVPFLAENRGGAVAIRLALGRDRAEKALRVFERVGRGGEPRFGEARRNQPGMRRAPGMERLRHRAEIGHDAARLRGRQRDRHGGLLGVEPAQRGASSAGADRTENAGRVPALDVMMAGVAARQLGPGLVAGDIGGEHLLATETQRLRLGQDRRHQHG